LKSESISKKPKLSNLVLKLPSAFPGFLECSLKIFTDCSDRLSVKQGGLCLIKKYSLFYLPLVGVILGTLLLPTRTYAYTANQASFEFLATGAYRVNLYYTVPSLREFREASIEFGERKQAEKFYFDVIRGADFYVNAQGDVEFNNGQLTPNPW
jgi:hypothetical protein